MCILETQRAQEREIDMPDAVYLDVRTLVLPMCDKRAKSAFILETLHSPAIRRKIRKQKWERGIGGLPIEQTQ